LLLVSRRYFLSDLNREAVAANSPKRKLGVIYHRDLSREYGDRIKVSLTHINLVLLPPYSRLIFEKMLAPSLRLGLLAAAVFTA